MKKIVISSSGGPEVLVEVEAPDPVADTGEVVIDVAAAGVNRADVSQRLGHYPPPPGAPDWPGLEVSGTVSALGPGVEGWNIGDRVCALLPGGGYASRVVARAAHLLRVPAGMDLVEAAALPEAIATVWTNVFDLGALRAGDTLLVHGGSSGIGTTAIQLARAHGAVVAVTAGSEAKLAACAALGAGILIDYTSSDFVERLLAATGGRGADVVLDAIGGDYVARDIAVLAPHGRIVLIGNQSGSPARFEIGHLMQKWGSIHGTTLRARPVGEKDRIMREVAENVWPYVEAGHVVPVVDRRFALSEAAQAHERMESSAHIGKLLLIP